MKIITYNVNGIRAAIKKGLIQWIQEVNPDIICFQEIKADEIDIDSSMFQALGYQCHWFSAQKKGYSGTGIITKLKNFEIIKGNSQEQGNYEGRTIQMIFEETIVVNTYFPSGSSGEERQGYKMKFLDEYLVWLKTLKGKFKNVIICGDYNICHKAIDIHNPVSNKNTTGFLPEEREWMDTFFELGLNDTFRIVNPHPHQYTWWSTRFNARANNKGWRIDYINISDSFKSQILDAQIFPEAIHSDHCPVMLELDL